MSRDDEVDTNDGVQQRPAEEPTTPMIEVSTVFCEIETGRLHCELYDPVSTSLQVPPPFVVSIVNGRNCQGDNPEVKWKMGGACGTLEPGGTESRTMTDDREILELSYDNCCRIPAGSHEIADPPTTPRVTINLIKSGNV